MEIQIKFSSGKIKKYQSGVRAEEILKDDEFKDLGYSPIAVMVNNTCTSLSYKIEINSTIIPLSRESREGINVYRRSLCYLLTIASKRIFPERRLIIGHSLGKGYFYYFDNMDYLNDSDINALCKEMKSLIKKDLPISRHSIAYLEAVKYFKENNQPDTVLLLLNRNDAKIPVNICGDFIDIAHRPLVPRTGMLNVFGIKNYPPGFILRYPALATPYEISPFKDDPLLFSVYREYKMWSEIHNINCIGMLNEKIKAGQVKEFIEIAEALHDKKIAEIADKIQNKINELQLILIAGPSSSGKTTVSKKLSLQLKVLGINPVTISLDDYFLPREKTPKDKEGNYDFESLSAIDIDRLNENLWQLQKGKEVLIATYDFITGKSSGQMKRLKLTANSVLILEGIHGLNNELTPSIKRKHKFQVYVSALTQLNLDDHNRIPTTDIRLLRRMVRDNQFRGNSAFTTLKMWPSVQRGENEFIFPYQNQADIAFNSCLDYELAVLKVYAEPLLKTVKPDVIEYNEADRMLRFLNNVIPIPPNWVPPQSILREFIGESGFSY